jgi:hypothetical protein
VPTTHPHAARQELPEPRRAPAALRTPHGVRLWCVVRWRVCKLVRLCGSSFVRFCVCVCVCVRVRDVRCSDARRWICSVPTGCFFPCAGVCRGNVVVRAPATFPSARVVWRVSCRRKVANCSCFPFAPRPVGLCAAVCQCHSSLVNRSVPLHNPSLPTRRPRLQPLRPRTGGELLLGLARVCVEPLQLAPATHPATTRRRRRSVAWNPRGRA